MLRQSRWQCHCILVTKSAELISSRAVALTVQVWATAESICTERWISDADQMQFCRLHIFWYGLNKHVVRHEQRCDITSNVLEIQSQCEGPSEEVFFPPS